MAAPELSFTLWDILNTEMEVSSEILEDGIQEERRKGDYKKKLSKEMQLENVKDSISMLSKEIPDMVFIAKNGQSVSCHRYWISSILILIDHTLAKFGWAPYLTLTYIYYLFIQVPD